MSGRLTLGVTAVGAAVLAADLVCSPRRALVGVFLGLAISALGVFLGRICWSLYRSRYARGRRRARAGLPQQLREAARTGPVSKIQEQYGVRYSWADGAFDEISFPTRDEAQAEVDSDPQWRTLVYRTCAVPIELPWGPWHTAPSGTGPNAPDGSDTWRRSR